MFKTVAKLTVWHAHIRHEERGARRSGLMFTSEDSRIRVRDGPAAKAAHGVCSMGILCSMPSRDWEEH